MTSRRHELKEGWEFKSLDDPEDAWLSVSSVPSAVHTDLLAHKKIPDPFLDLNELAVRWVADKDWTYRLRFTPPSPSNQEDVSELVFEGLDTLASVRLNGKEILTSENMFLAHRIDITQVIKPGESNEITIVFQSALRRGRELVEENSDKHNFLARQTEQGRLPIRKAQYHWGWDWGPILITAGIWRPVYLEYHAGRVADVWSQSEVSPDLSSCAVRIFTKTEEVDTTTDKVLVSLSLDGKTVFTQECNIDIDASGKTESSLTLDKPELWYPKGYGAQPRYKLEATLLRGSDKKKLNSMSKLIGFRRAELIQEPDAHGTSFYFKINNIDVFAGGSCWIPGDSFLPSISPQRYRDWMQLMVDSNQIMIRLWGGGIYEDDVFLDAADEMGILVWHDFGFACGSYPTYPSFLASVEEEARQNVQRMRGRPSLVIWAGNNEDYQVQERYQLEYKYEEDKDPESWLKSTFPARYIYEYLLPKIVEEEDPGMIYHPSSPWGQGKPTADPTVGDLHQWNLWHGALNKYQDAHLLTGRFISEFGMHGNPHMETLEAYITSPTQRRPGSQVLDYRNKAYDDIRRLWAYLADNLPFPLPPQTFDLEMFTYLSQVVQSETMSHAYKSWRRDWGDAEKGRKCGGVLVWQLNDAYPTVSWAVVDYYLVPKPGFYAIQRAMRTLDVGIRREYHEWTKCHADPVLALKDVKFDVWVASSQLTPVEAELELRFISIRTGMNLREKKIEKIAVKPNATTEVLLQEQADVPVQETFDTESEEWDPYVIHATLIVNGETVASETNWPQPLKHLTFTDPIISIRRKAEKTSDIDGEVFTVSSMKPVKAFVIQEKRGMKLTENGFDLVPGQEVVVKVDGAHVDELRCRWLGSPGTVEFPSLY